jgi:hypothetical protein
MGYWQGNLETLKGDILANGYPPAKASVLAVKLREGIWGNDSRLRKKECSMKYIKNLYARIGAWFDAWAYPDDENYDDWVNKQW